MKSRRTRFLILAAWVACIAVAAPAQTVHLEPVVLEGETAIHDPSTILRLDGRYYIFGTGRGILTKSSPDLQHWTNGAPVFNPPPAWTTNAVPGYRGHTWAPDVIRLGGAYHLYYSVSTFGKQVSAIGLATNPTLDPASPDFQWTDRGPVIQSTNGLPFNAIDPAVTLDRDGKLWLAWGSFWKGIFITELDPKSGLRLPADSAIHRLAWNESIEAAAIQRHGDDYFLFVNWGRCCRGTNSTYEVRVGRSRSITGPYLDQDGADLVEGGGTPFLESSGRFIGPGHMAFFRRENAEWFSYHYYDAGLHGRSQLAIAPLFWTKDGWPTVKNPEQASN
jgi:arabinan endo-1,5-alpha-L-arabinosidase